MPADLPRDAIEAFFPHMIGNEIDVLSLLGNVRA